MTHSPQTTREASVPDYGVRRLTVELTNFCNLHCSYCVRDDDALHHDPAVSLPVETFERIARSAVDAMSIEHIAFTGGEPTLHPRFGDILAAVESLSLTCSFVTNGWHFDRVWPRLVEHREALTHVSFSLDGATREAHDHWRGKGSFERVIRAFSRCWAAQLPFAVKVGLRRDTVPDLERFALFAARMGAMRLSFAHLMPTSSSIADRSALTLEERAAAEREIAHLARIFRMPVALDVGYYNVAQAAPCAPLHGVSANVDYRGQLTLCCNLSGFRGATGAGDVVGDLNREAFAAALERLRHLASAQSANRAATLAALAAHGETADLTIGSPCLFCMSTLGKTPWLPGSPQANRLGFPLTMTHVASQHS
jgi:MoaA/NifB/PqqE/SkfB family radical SAM enzyme